MHGGHLDFPADLDESANLRSFIVDNVKKSEIIIDGYLRRCWKRIEFLNMSELPIELIGVITMYYQKECIHLIQRTGGEHWKVDMDDIFAACGIE